MTKPDLCRTCPYQKGSTGFLPDLVPLAPLAAFVGRFPIREDLAMGEAWASRAGRGWEREFLMPYGFKREQVLFSNVLRCYPNGSEFPTGRQRTEAVHACRRWDTALEDWKPNAWVVTISPTILLSTPNQAVFLKRGVEKVRMLVDQGYRPVLLMGEEARETYMPWLHGSQKEWQGYWATTVPSRAA